jgi:hypothetical protein
LFELNLRDERFLPFEGAGAISTWRLEIPNDVPQFDFESISDVVLHIRYTCREAGHLRAVRQPTSKKTFCKQQEILCSCYAELRFFHGLAPVCRSRHRQRTQASIVVGQKTVFRIG